MVDYGMQVTNSSDITIIDGIHKNHICHAHGTTHLNGHTTNISIPAFSSNGLIFFKPVDFFVNAYGFEMDEADIVAINIASDSTGYIDWAIFKEIESTDPSELVAYGVTIYNSDEEPVFTTVTDGYVNLVAKYGFPSSPLTVDDTDNYFCLISMPYSYVLNVLISGGTKTVTYDRRIVGIKKTGATTLELSPITYEYQQVISSEAGDSNETRNGSVFTQDQLIIEIKTKL